MDTIPSKAAYDISGIHYEVCRAFSGDAALPEKLAQEIISASKAAPVFDRAANA